MMGEWIEIRRIKNQENRISRKNKKKKKHTHKKKKKKKKKTQKKKKQKKKKNKTKKKTFNYIIFCQRSFDPTFTPTDA